MISRFPVGTFLRNVRLRVRPSSFHFAATAVREIVL